MSEVNEFAKLYKDKFSPSKPSLHPKFLKTKEQELAEDYKVYLKRGGTMGKKQYLDKKMRKLVEGVLPDNMVRQYQDAAKKQKEQGAYVEIDEKLPTVSVKLADGKEYFFQGQEAQELLDEVPENINEEDYILHNAIGWG